MTEEQIQDEIEDEAQEDTQDTQEVETQETEAQPEAPSIVKDYFPQLSQKWNTLPQDVQSELLADLATNIEAGTETPDDPESEGKAPEAAPAKGTPAKGGPAQLTDADVSTLLDGLYGEEDTAQRTAFKRLIERMRWLEDYATEVGELSLSVARNAETSVTTIRDERAFEKALEKHSDDLRAVSDAEYSAIVKSAQEIKTAGRVANWGDAVSLALLQSRRGAPASTAKNARTAIAASMAGGSRTPRQPKRRVVNSFDDAREIALEQYSK
jgi:hypothetical protein